MYFLAEIDLLDFHSKGGLNMNNRQLNIYIATLPRSGSTLLGMMLNNHSEIFHTGESSYWGKLNPKYTICSCGEKRCPILMSAYEKLKSLPEVHAIYEACSMADKIEEPGKIYHKFSLPDKNDSNRVNLSILNKKLLLSCFGLEKIADVFRELTKKEIIVDGTKNIYIAEHLAERVGWKIIILIRDPRGIASSNKNAGRRKNVPRPIEMKIPIFINFAKKTESLTTKNNVLLVRYEDLCADPKKKLCEICDFLEIAFENRILQFKSDKGHTLMGNRMRFDDSEKIIEDLSWIENLSQQEKLLICKNWKLVLLYEKFGYQF